MTYGVWPTSAPFRMPIELVEEAAMSLSFSLETLALMIEEVFPEIAAVGSDDLDGLGICPDCGADLYTEGCPSCWRPTDL